eukprot:4554441-Prymnesium_polylepis.1
MADPRVVGGLVGVAGVVSAARVAARRRCIGAARVARDGERSAGARQFRHFLRFPCMVRIDGA